MTFRDIARIAKCSTGAVGAEMRAMKAEAKRKVLEVVLPNLIELDDTTPQSNEVHQGQVFDLSIQDLHLELAE